MITDEHNSIEALRKNGVRVDSKSIVIPEKGVGLKMWRNIDFLCKTYKYTWVKGEYERKKNE